MHVEVRLTDGSAPIGNGIGPALEARDVVSVLQNEVGAPGDLRHKAPSRLFHSCLRPDCIRRRSRHPGVRTTGQRGCGKRSNACAQQGPPPEKIEIGRHTVTIVADTDGTVDFIDRFALATIARAAGAPVDKGVGLDLFARAGDAVQSGQPLYRIHAQTETGLEGKPRSTRSRYIALIRPDGSQSNTSGNLARTSCANSGEVIATSGKSSICCREYTHR